MPSSTRKSSIGSGIRRGPQKAHIPYRGDNPEVGKKTGFAVQHVERRSDGFEEFEELIRQADGKTPPRPKKRKSSMAQSAYHDSDYDDDDGEMSMQIESPVQRLVNMRPPTTPTTNGRRRSSMRPVARTSVDFDEIPSPRPLGSKQRGARNSAPGPSNLSRSTRAASPPRESPEPDDYDGGNDQSGFDDYGPQEHDQTFADSSPRHETSLSRIEEDDQGEEEDEEEDQEATPRPTKSPHKGKLRAIDPPERDQSEEDEIAQGLEGVDLAPGSEDDEEEEEEERTIKKFKPSPKKSSPRKTKSRSKKENREYREGVRRSSRAKIVPLDWWRGERCVYGRPNGPQKCLVASVKEIIRIPKDDPPPLGNQKRKRGSTRPRSQSKALNDDIPPAAPVVNPEEDWDDETEAKCTVIHFTTQEEVHRRIAWTAKMVQPRLAADHNWSFDKIFGDDEFIAAGQLIIPPGGRKPSKAAKDNTYVFYVIEGAVNFKIHNTSMILASGAMIMVPRGNTYFIENICQRDAKLFFTQARKVEMNTEEMAAKQEAIAEMHRRKSQGRSSSVGVLAAHKTPPKSIGRAQSMAVLPSRG